MEGAALLGGSAVAVAGVAVLRYAWGLPARSAGLNAAGWGAMLLGTVLGATAHGAWGIAVVSLVATTAAFAILTYAAATAKANGGRASERRANVLPERAPLNLGRRLATFALNVPLAFLVSMAVAVAARGLAGWAGWSEADGNVLTLFLLPLLWMALVTVLLMTDRRRTQMLALAIPAVLAGTVLLTGGQA